MALNYNPEDAVRLWPVGVYDATLTKVEATTSKVKPDGSGGNPMEVWTLDVYDENGNKQIISDYVVIPAGTFKIKQLAQALDFEDEFKAGQFQAENHIGAGLAVELAIEKQPGFDDKNRIKKYRAPAANPDAPTGAPSQRQSSAPPQRQRQPVTSPIGEGQEFKDDDVPF